jgi:hypothetical protein
MVRDELHGQGFALLDVVLFAILALAVWGLTDLSFGEKIALSVAVLAIITAFIPLVQDGLKENIVDANFRKAVKKFKIGKEEEEKRLLLKALLKIKATNPIFKLKTAKGMHPELFKKEKLLDKLYE